jgi:transcriptional regulator with XRE-family HTH domain
MGRNVKIAFENKDKYIALGLNIAYYRKREGMTQEQLAERAGISRSYLGEIEAPNMITNISLEVLFNLSKVLKLPPQKLLEFRE